MYLLFRYHHILPSQFIEMGYGERNVMKAFMHFQVEKTSEELEKINNQ